MLAESHLFVRPVGLEDHGEVVVGILVDLGSLVLMLDVFDGQRMELESLCQHPVVVVIWSLDVEPQAGVRRVFETSFDVGDLRLGHLALGRDQGSHAAHAKEYADGPLCFQVACRKLLRSRARSQPATSRTANERGGSSWEAVS